LLIDEREQPDIDTVIDRVSDFQVSRLFNNKFHRERRIALKIHQVDVEGAHAPR